MSVNKVILVGNVGKQPEIRSSQSSGEELATFSLATSERWKDKTTGETKEKTEWHRVVVFSPGLIKIIKDYVQKGSKLYLEGSLQTREYRDQAGVTKYTTEVVLGRFNSTLNLLDSKKDREESGSFYSIDEKEPEKLEDEKINNEYDIEEIEDEIPF